MTLPGLDNLDVIAWRPAAADEYIALNGLFFKGPYSTPNLIVAPVEGYQFQYDIVSDRLRLIPSATGEVAQSAASAVPLTSLSFQQAFSALDKDHMLKIARASWKDRWLEWDVAHHPTLADVRTVGARMSWVHVKSDLVARDWMIVAGYPAVK